MFTWKRVEVLVTLSLDYYRQAQTLLQKHQITNQSRRVKIAGGQQRSGDGMLQRTTTEFHLYVHKDDYDRARALIQTIGPDSQLSMAPEAEIKGDHETVTKIM